MKRPPLIKGTFLAKGEVSATLTLPPGTIVPLYRVHFRHTGANPGHVAFHRYHDAEECWRDTWYGAVRSSCGFLSKPNGKAEDIRLVCTYCPEPIDYALTYVRPDVLEKALQERPVIEQLELNEPAKLLEQIENPDSWLFVGPSQQQAQDREP